MSRIDIITKAASQDGTKENPPGSNKQPYGEWYGMNGEKWCAIFVSWVYHHAGHPLGKIETPNGYHYCQGGYQFFRSNGQITKSPRQGDIIFYDWSGDGHCDHTGIFDCWSDATKKYFFAWEGNTEMGNDSDGGKVMRRKRAVSLVRGFASPAVLGAAAPLINWDLAIGDTGAEVSEIQKLLWQLRYDVQVDGDFGPQTEKAVKKFQQDHFLLQTGIVTPMLKASISEVVFYANTNKKSSTASHLSLGNAGPIVIQLQEALKKQLNISGLKADGVFGPETFDAVKHFQQSKHLTADGVVGPKTFAALGII